jgi:hypothetical protein
MASRRELDITHIHQRHAWERPPTEACSSATCGLVLNLIARGICARGRSTTLDTALNGLMIHSERPLNRKKDRSSR